MIIEIKIKPQPAPRPRVTRWGAYNDPKYTDYKEIVKSFVKEYIKEPLNGAIAIEVNFIFEVPKSWNKVNKENAKWHKSKPDIDNLQKGIMDSLNGIAYKDDSQVSYMIAKKEYGAENKIMINLYELESFR